MLNERIFDKDDEYFLAMAKKGFHSFLMLGVIENNTPQLLARVGKINDIDPDSKNIYKTLFKNLYTKNLARLVDEGLARHITQIDSIAYQAYSINYEQMQEFLELIAYLEKKQLENKGVRDALHRMSSAGIKLNSQPIRAYVPIKEQLNNGNNIKVVFRHQALNDWHPIINSVSIKTLESRDKIAKEIGEININNTCRHSAINMLEAILAFKTNISTQFFIPLNYKTKLRGGLPDKTSFYVLPLPPTIYKDLNPYQLKALKKLYKRLEEIPKTHYSDLKTRKKFAAVKELYKTIAGQTTLSAIELLQEVIDFETSKEDQLFQQRSNRFISFFTPTPATKKVFQKIKCDLSQEANADENQLYSL
ncbi:hypothetical protein ACNVED_03315 [Legionella sp. D16C41]|uniref:hypothetical protein n=1 Tax=Legionella sp. D16C41 TaxID=3402688 RepID=UPI003AF71E2E